MAATILTEQARLLNCGGAVVYTLPAVQCAGFRGADYYTHARGDTMLLRRVLSFAVVVLVVPLLVLQIAMVSASYTLLQTDYLADRLEEAGAYDFLLDRLLPTALDDARNAKSLSVDGTLDSNPLIVLGISNRHLVAWTTSVAPREWFDETVRTAAKEVWAYVIGRSDEFAVTLRLPTEDEVLASETSNLLRHSHLYDYAVDSHLVPAAEEILTAEVLPFGSELSTARVESAVRHVVSKGWFDARVADAVTAFVPYATGSERGFDVRMDLAELGPAATAEYKLLLHDTGAYDSLYDSIVEPAVLALNGERIELAPGVLLHTEDVVTAIRDSGRGQWARGEVDRAVDEVSGYLFAETDSFSFVVTLDPIADEVTSRLEDVVHGRILALSTVIGRNAADAQARRAVAGRADIILADVGPLIVEPLRGEVTFTDLDMRDALSRQDNEQLDDIRLLMKDGFLYTEEDLRGDIRRSFDDPESVEQAIETVRDLFSDGWTFTYFDLLEATRGEISHNDFESIRYGSGLVRMLLWIVPVLAGIGLVAVFLLADGRWHVRAAWVAATVSAGALAACALFAAVHFATGASYEASRADAALASNVTSELAYTQALVDVWMLDLGRAVVGGFTSDIAIKSGVSGAVALLALVAALCLPQLEPLLRRYAWPRRR